MQFFVGVLVGAVALFFALMFAAWRNRQVEGTGQWEWNGSDWERTYYHPGGELPEQYITVYREEGHEEH